MQYYDNSEDKPVNAKKALLKIKGGVTIKAADIELFTYEERTRLNEEGEEETYNECLGNKYQLKIGHTTQELEKFLTALDFWYTPEFYDTAAQGIIWLSDGSWIQWEHEQYWEGWVHTQCPTLPEYLQE